MAFDGLVTRAITEELKEYLLAGKVEKIYQPGADELVVSVHGPKGRVRFYASCNNEHAGIFLTEDSFDNPAEPPVFCMLMRKHLQGSRISGISQVGCERIIELTFESRDEMGFVTDKKLIVETMGRHSNIVLVDIKSGKIIDSIKRVSIDESRVRQILPGQPYSYPPPQDKIPFIEVTLETIKNFPEGRELSKTVLDNVSGLSPVMARLISEDEEAEAVYDKLRDIINHIDNHELKPVVYVKEDGIPADFHIVDIPEYRERYQAMEFDNISGAVSWFYSHRNASNRVRQKAKTLEKTVAGLLKKMRLKKQRLHEDLQKAENSEEYRLYGELITANIHLMKTGDKEVTLTNYYDGLPVTIPLDVRYAPAKNAQIYFKKYSKSKTAIIEKKKQLEETDGDIEYLDSVAGFIDSAQTTEELDMIRQELMDTGFIRRRKTKGVQKKKKLKPYEYRTSGGFRVLVGRNNKENDELTTKKAGRADLWFHTKDIPGSHTILFTEGREVDDDSIFEAARIAAWHSKGRESENVPVDYTEIKHVKKPNGAKPGMVIFTDNRTVYVTPVDPSSLLSSDNR